MKKDCLSEVLRCWIEEIEERGRWLRAQLGPQPPNFPRYISSANVSTKCQREINKKRIWRSSHWKGLCADDFSLLLCTTVKKKEIILRKLLPPKTKPLPFCRNNFIPKFNYKTLAKQTPFIIFFLSMLFPFEYLIVSPCPFPFISTFSAQIFAFHLGRKKKQVVFGRQILPLTHCVLSKHTLLHCAHCVYCSKI